jgi:hypothetical protein
LVNKTGVSIHHVVKPMLLFPVAFIFDERAALMVNRWYRSTARGLCARPAREPEIKLIGLNKSAG